MGEEAVSDALHDASRKIVNQIDLFAHLVYASESLPEELQMRMSKKFDPHEAVLPGSHREINGGVDCDTILGILILIAVRAGSTVEYTP